MIEILFLNETFYDSKKYPSVAKLIKLRNGIARVNFPALYGSYNYAGYKEWSLWTGKIPDNLYMWKIYIEQGLLNGKVEARN